MQVQIDCKARLENDVRSSAEERVRFVMRRLVQRVSRAVVLLSDINGPRGGVDKCCQVTLKTEGKGVLVIRTLAADWRSALDQALQRAVRLLTRVWQRRGDPAVLRQAKRRALRHALEVQ
ncbi:MAG: HPF/RaiA family ribosome-associated protein [Betaproteobacteria bacterium]|jgi:siroheme synthase (precorrin-2 oxidase/ferrochelatase)|nr:HPF/RaiA family ribosome-associated protein [Betaproteobacteria bacterium]